MSPPDKHPGGEGVHFEAEAAGDATIIQVGRDQHFHFGPGRRRVRPIVRPDAADECPYPGLAAFGCDQADWFFGRDELTADLVRQLNECLTDGGPLMVVAPSGAGKSSLLQAACCTRSREALSRLRVRGTGRRSR